MTKPKSIGDAICEAQAELDVLCDQADACLEAGDMEGFERVMGQMQEALSPGATTIQLPKDEERSESRWR